ncbi:hypothetical protein Cgig2_032641 [Carnegiea gigantea]|uniref:Reverse transcriptase n=1 Tax=Carnegiea gigantea TaxID=171969 RepID=A0A9Q1GVW2_9CARY|nr:hypothetical protein Cgig2_032641 [Carnegiea gigantea]
MKYKDDNTRLFHAKAKQRKLATYIHSTHDANGKIVEGFDQVQQVMFDFYMSILGRQQGTRKNINMQVIQLGLTFNCDHHIGLCKQFSSKDIKDALFSIPSFKSPGPDGYNSGFFKATWGKIGLMICSAIQDFPMKYLGVPITASRLTKIECRGLVDKILAKVHLWATRSLSFAGRARLISSVVFEDETHVFFTCNYAREVWADLGNWWRQIPPAQNSPQLLKQMLHSKETRACKQITGVIMTATIYHIWRARNQLIFNEYKLSA